MSYVDVSVFTQQAQGMEGRLGITEGRLNEILSNVEQTIGKHETMIGELVGKFPDLQVRMEQLTKDVTEHMKTSAAETKDHVAKRIDGLEIAVRDRDANLNALIQSTQANVNELNKSAGEIRAQINHIQMTGTAGSTGGESRDKKLIVAKNIQLTKYGANGDKDTQLLFDEWRDDMEEYLNAYRPVIKYVLQKAARYPEDIDEDNCGELVRRAGIRCQGLMWILAPANDEFYTFNKKH